MLGDRVRATRYFAYSGEVAIAALVVAVIGLMILPLPTPMIDTLLGINITLSVVLLMVTMYVPDSISLSSFPSLLLFTTLLRLSLNIASTKSILLHAEAGHIIESFGELVVGGNLVVGLVVFFDHHHRAVHRDRKGLRTRCRGRCALHVGRNARQADEYRCRPAWRQPDRR